MELIVCLVGFLECCRFLDQDFHLVHRTIPMFLEWFFIFNFLYLATKITFLSILQTP